jgi:hypothetical protein
MLLNHGRLAGAVNRPEGPRGTYLLLHLSHTVVRMDPYPTFKVTTLTIYSLRQASILSPGL